MTHARLYLLALLLLAALTSSTGSQEPPRKPKKESLMERKLATAQKLLGAIALNDFVAIKEYAGTLNDVSKLAAWKLIETPRYENYSVEFQRITLQMANRANDKNLDGVALSYVDMTLTCVKCHQHVREVKIGMNSPARPLDEHWVNK